MGECRLELPILMLPNACGTLDIQAGRLCRTGGNNSVVECDLAKVEVAGSNPVSRSIIFFPHSRYFLPTAPSPSGKAEVCKTSIPGSNPGGASISHSHRPAASAREVLNASFFSRRLGAWCAVK